MFFQNSDMLIVEYVHKYLNTTLISTNFGEKERFCVRINFHAAAFVFCSHWLTTCRDKLCLIKVDHDINHNLFLRELTFVLVSFGILLHFLACSFLAASNLTLVWLFMMSFTVTSVVSSPCAGFNSWPLLLDSM